MANIRVQMWGPDFIPSAFWALHDLIPGHLTRLDIYAGQGSPALPTLLPALYLLAPFLNTSALVMLHVDRSRVSDSTRDAFAQAVGQTLFWDANSDREPIDGQPVWVSEDDSRVPLRRPPSNGATNNQSTTAQKAAERADSYIRS